jgi:hypothetical protein
MVVPKAAVDKNRYSIFRENHVGLARQIVLMKAIAIPKAEQTPAQFDLRPRVFRPNRRHHSASSRRVNSIHAFRSLASTYTMVASSNSFLLVL